MASRQRFNWLAPVLRLVVRALTPHIEEGLENMVRNLYEKAKETENDIDNIFCELLADLLDIEL